MKKSKIKELGEMMLASNQKLDEVHLTSDGMGYSQLHIAENRQNEINKALKVITVKRKEEGNTGDNDSIIKLPVKDLIEALKNVADKEALEKLLAEETAKGKDARKTALEAIQERIEAVENPAS